MNTLKVAIPPELHLKLTMLKVVKGQRIQDTVVIALEMYFAELERPGREVDVPGPWQPAV